MVGIRTWLQVNSNVSDKVAGWLPRDDAVKTFPICESGRPLNARDVHSLRPE